MQWTQNWSLSRFHKVIAIYQGKKSEGFREYYRSFRVKHMQLCAINEEAFTRRCSVKKVFLKISQNSRENTCARVSFLIKSYLKKKLWHWCFPVNFAKFSGTPFSIEQLWWLILSMQKVLLPKHCRGKCNLAFFEVINLTWH